MPAFGALLSIAALAICDARETPVFAIEEDSFGEGEESVALKVLKNRRTGEHVEIAWKNGGRTEELVLQGPSGKLRSVLLTSRRNASDVRANTGWKGDILLPYANRVRNGTFHFNGHTYHLERNEDRTRFGYGKGGIHGYLYGKELHVQHATANNTAAELTLSYSFDGKDPGYPFSLVVVLTYTLSAEGFTLRTTARNAGTDGEPLPFQNSWHSYFAVSDVSKAYVTLDPCTRWNHVDVTNSSNIWSDLIPTGRTTPFEGFDGRKPIGGSQKEPTYWDDEFKAIAPVERCPRLEVSVFDPSAEEKSVLWMDSSYRWVQVFTAAPQNFGVENQAIAVEAMRGQADAWNSMQGVQILQAGEEVVGEFGVAVRAALEASAIVNV